MNEIVKGGKSLPLLAMIAVGLAWAQSDPFDRPPPPEVEEALRSRITQFYDLLEQGKFRETEQLVAKDSRESYYTARKSRVYGASVREIDFSSDLRTAKVLVTLKAKIPLAGSTLFDMPIGTQWAWEEENWFLVLPKTRPGDQVPTPFGAKTMGPETSGAPGPSVGRPPVPSIAALKKMYADGSERNPAAPAAGTTAPRPKSSPLSYSLVRKGSGTPEEFIVSLSGRRIRIDPDAVDGWVDEVRQQTESTRVSGWASDGAHRELTAQVVVFVDGEANHERSTVVKRPDVARFFKVRSLRQAGFRVELPVSVFDRDPAPVVRVFAISRTGVASELYYHPEYSDGPRTVKLGTENQRSALCYSLARTKSRTPEESIVSLSGTTIRIVPGATDGWVGVVKQSAGRTQVRGWASDGAHHELAHQVAVFVDGLANHERHITSRRPDVVKYHKAPSLEQSGFRVVLPTPIFDRAPPPVVRVFAISRQGTASELHYHHEYVDGPRSFTIGER